MVTNHRDITTIDFFGFKFHLAKYVQGWFLNSFTSFIDVAHFIGKLSKNKSSFLAHRIEIQNLITNKNIAKSNDDDPLFIEDPYCGVIWR